MLAIYSGNCKEGYVGTPTNLRAIDDKELFVGDIVITLHKSEYSDEYSPVGLSAVVSDEYTSYSDGSFVKKEEEPTYFVMGIKSVTLNSGEWAVMRVKSFEDVIDGEHWKAYGFNYKKDKEQPND